MESLRNTHKILMKERTSAIRRGLLDTIDSRARLIAIKGSRGVGKTNFLLDFCKDHYKDDPSCLYVNINNLFFAMEGLFNFVERFYKLGGKVLLLDQIHKYPNWDRELREATIVSRICRSFSPHLLFYGSNPTNICMELWRCTT